jgi:16S rRNA (guanine527-N7)-methyltransferase
MTPGETLMRGLIELRMELPSDAVTRLIDYVALLRKWNRVYNLTAVREPQEMVTRHLLDCLAVLPHVSARTILDVGSGAGLPGIPLALALPRALVTLLDSSEKKASFLKQAVIELRLANATVVQERVEAWRTRASFELVITRAFADLAEFLALAGRLCARNGVMAVMKGALPQGVLDRLAPGFELKKVVPLQVPGLRAERHLVLVQRA